MGKPRDSKIGEAEAEADAETAAVVAGENHRFRAEMSGKSAAVAEEVTTGERIPWEEAAAVRMNPEATVTIPAVVEKIGTEVEKSPVAVETTLAMAAMGITSPVGVKKLVENRTAEETATTKKDPLLMEFPTKMFDERCRRNPASPPPIGDPKIP